MSNRDVLRHADADALAEAAAGRLVAAVVEAQEQRGQAHVVLTGGGIGTAVLVALAASPAVSAIDWHRIHLWWGDERYLPTGDPERNDTAAHVALIDQVAIPRDRVHSIPGPDTSDSPQAAALAYGESLLRIGEGALPEFDVVLLGIGPDAHVASLFPEHPATHAVGNVVAVHNSPKPPPTRVSLTFAALNNARQALILASGPSKAEAVRLALEEHAGPLQVPASGIHAAQQTLFLIDEEAARELPADFGRPGA
ncbi:MAG: 6-phosphogluconolactonase [Candidatus Nanopelagicales bacterium]